MQFLFSLIVSTELGWLNLKNLEILHSKVVAGHAFTYGKTQAFWSRIHK